MCSVLFNFSIAYFTVGAQELLSKCDILYGHADNVFFLKWISVEYNHVSWVMSVIKLCPIIFHIQTNFFVETTEGNYDLLTYLY